MWQYTYQDELYHYGVKGMKWGQHIFGKDTRSGVRKNQNPQQISKSNKRFNSPEESDRELLKLATTLEGQDKLYGQILDKCGDFYNKEGISPSIKKIMDEYDKKLDAIDKKYGFNDIEKQIQEIHNTKVRPGSIAEKIQVEKLLKLLDASTYKRNNQEYLNEKRRARNDYDQKTAGEVLNQLGYENTPTARQALLDNNLIWVD